MSVIVFTILFLLGAAIGSFLNVAILRYDPDRRLFSNVDGRSHCMSCDKTLRWYELIPLFSFVFQLGKCRSCGERLSIQYPIVEFLSGFIFVAVPYLLIPSGGDASYLEVGIWISALLSLLLISVIDFRIYIIPDGLNMTIFGLGILNALNIYFTGNFGEIRSGIYNSIVGGTHTLLDGSFLGTRAWFLFMPDNLILNFVFGALFGAIFFGAIYFLSGGRAMGFGDVKMAFAAGFLLGLPDMILATMLAFIVGAIAGLFMMALRKKGMKDHLPFGPFIALGITLVFFFGYDIVDAYFRFFSFLE